jgi:hypothetical protein
MPDYAEACLQALASQDLGGKVSLGGAFGLLHYLDYRPTHDVDAWWVPSATAEDQHRVIGAIEATLRPFGQIGRRAWGDVVSVDLIRGSRVAFSFRIARPSAQLEPLALASWTDVLLDSFPDLLTSRATPLGEGGFAHMARLAREFGLHLAGSLLERHTGGACGERRFADSRTGSGERRRTVSNTAALDAPDGSLLGSYRKIHRFRLMQEHRYLAPGDCATLCPTPWGPVGLTICYDLRSPELFRAMALAGAVLFLVPAQ